MTAARKKAPAAGKLGGRGRSAGDSPTRVGTAESARGTAEPTRRRRGRPAAAGVPRDQTYELRVTSEERARYEAAAAAQGMPLSAWMRQALSAMAAGPLVGACTHCRSDVDVFPGDSMPQCPSCHVCIARDLLNPR